MGRRTDGCAVESSGSGSVQAEVGRSQDQQKMEEAEPIQVQKLYYDQHGNGKSCIFLFINCICFGLVNICFMSHIV